MTSNYNFISVIQITDHLILLVVILIWLGMIYT